MLLIPRLKKDGQLFLDAYSYQEKELNTVATVLMQYNIRSKIQELPSDKEERRGRRYIILPEDIHRLEEALSIKFQGEEEQTYTQLYPQGIGYKCQEITLRGQGSGCVDLSASNEADACVKCALIANEKGWLGGVATVGGCSSVVSKILKIFG